MYLVLPQKNTLDSCALSQQLPILSSSALIVEDNNTVVEIFIRESSVYFCGLVLTF